MKRRTFVSGTAALGAAALGHPAFAATIKPYSWDLNPPTDTRENFIAWGKGRGEDPTFLGQRWDRFQALLKNKDIWGAATMRAFLLTPREEFASVNPAIYKRAYEHNFLDIGYGVTMSGPHLSGPHDQRDRRQARREGARDRHRLRRSSRPISPT